MNDCTPCPFHWFAALDMSVQGCQQGIISIQDDNRDIAVEGCIRTILLEKAKMIWLLTPCRFL
jgi:hypothetical protein